MKHCFTSRMDMDKARYLTTTGLGRHFADKLINVRKETFRRIGLL